MPKTFEDHTESFIDRRNLLLKEIEPRVIRKAWFTLSHLLLDEKAKVVDMGCGDGVMTFAMAAMNPKIRFIGVDKNRRSITRAAETYELHNLEYRHGDVSGKLFDDESIDAIINSDILHEIFSFSRYNEIAVRETLQAHFKMLKKGGAMFIRDFARPPPGEFVLVEMPDEPSLGKSIAQMSDADLLVWYAEHARPKDDAGCGGFFLEEIPPRRPKTRLFRLPHKWAYEFATRKDNRAQWQSELPVEHTFFTVQDFQRELKALGARVQYSGPSWEQSDDGKAKEQDIKFFNDFGEPMADPASCYVVLAYKMGERRSLHVEERRPSGAGQSALTIKAMRDQVKGTLVEIVTRNMDIAEIIPYFVDEEQRLKIYLNDGIVRGITNAVPRSGRNIDGRHWSSHMIEPAAVPNASIPLPDIFEVKESVLFARDHIGLKPQEGAVFEKGPEYYPSPDFIDEKVFTYYLRAERSRAAIQPRKILGMDDKFQARGMMREFDAQQVLNAITVGLIPQARLELQILSLFQSLNLKAETWTDKKIKFEAGEISGSKSLRKLLSTYNMDQKRYQDVKGSSGQLRAIHSTFVEEGQTRGAVAGISAQDIDFTVHEGRTINTAVILPLTSDLKGEIHAGFQLDHTPVPERREGNGLTAAALTIPLPPDIVSLRQMREYIAEKMSVTPEMVLKMGESYFSYIGLTPQRLYPFAIAVPAKFLKDPARTFMPLYQIMLMWQSLSRDHKFSKPGQRPKLVWDTNFMTILSRSYRYLPEGMKRDHKLRAQSIVKERLTQRGPHWAIPLTYAQAPSQEKEADKIEPVLNKEPLIALKALETESPAPQPAAAQPEAETPKQPLPESVTTTVTAAAPPPPSGLSSLMDEFDRHLNDMEEPDQDQNRPTPEKW